ncbi:MAG TPA: inositol monophosphatase family protein [Candidatus Thiothrix moscowensis]|uniref:inositol monophosphatase family protein n=1 Tax=unclassified Thiothrix TaxID=2636184 RepID=UPI0025D47380|nr:MULTISPECIES: inositol monophosphatase family protein [unclassified Thiothrix]HRJ54066.1 inositol monophosphatase family protein [Candidatus Thiothrix moscowensis]HRJ94212.1 inositol monophosphatase family protein [Candidatus Thiothrix moscowensis]
MLPDLQTLAQALRDIAREEILPRFERVGYSLKQDGSVLTEADLATDRRVRAFLHEHWPDIAFLSEEMEREEQERLLRESDALWCLDPLDGTSNFAAGIPLFASSLALIRQGEVVLALSYDPLRDEMFTAQRGQGAWLNGRRLQCQSTGFKLRNAVAVVDFKRLGDELKCALMKHPPYGSQRNIGSCVLEWAWMAANRGQLYLHGGMKLWDLAAGTLILSEAGGHACTLQGEPVFKAAMETRSVVVSPDPELFAAWLHYLQEHS